MKDFSPLGGGDINQVFSVTTDKGKFVVKINQEKDFPQMFKKEALGLQQLAEAQVLRVPKAIDHGVEDDMGYLLLEHISSGAKTDDFWKDFGVKLAQLHQNTQPTFGLNYDNYIGSLPQYNDTRTEDAATFYIEKRLEPQLKLARDRDYKFSGTNAFFKNIEDIIPKEKPALIHGDLWNGNFMTDKNGQACLIDPAVCFAPREMDIAMMHLFSGFSEELFKAYNQEFTLKDDWKKRLKIWQLYYLLVHLNLFGESYYSSVDQIISHYN